jgi:hypothetical protein
MAERHSWASASGSMPPASAFRHPISESPYSGTGPVPASAFLIIPVPDWLVAGQSDIPTFKKKGSTMHVNIAVGSGERDTHAVHVQTAGSEKFKSDVPFFARP